MTTYSSSHRHGSHLRMRAIAKAALLSASYIAIAAIASHEVRAQTATPAAAPASQLPPVQVDEPNRKPRQARPVARQRPATAVARPQAQPRTPQTAPVTPVSNPAKTFDARTGTTG